MNNKIVNNEIANYFTMSFLMPETEYREVFKKNQLDNGLKVNTKKIAEHFNVEISVAALRGVQLGLLLSW